MKRLNHLYAVIFTMITIVGTLSCSDDTDMPLPSPAATAGFPVALSLQSKAESSTPSLDYSIYVFSRNQDATTANYILDTLISPIREDSKLKFSNNDLKQKEYRFLFTATPAGTKEILLVTTGTSATPETGTSWENIRMISGEPVLSVDNYYQVKDLSGTSLLATDTIHGELSRIVGQTVFNFFKIDASSKEPQLIEPGFTSIFDRLDTVQITYTNYTPQLSFNTTGALIPATPNAQPLIQKIGFNLDRQLGVLIPQVQADTLPGGIRAGGQLKGFCFFPVTNALKATLVFYYYDTTPKCNIANHIHEKSCYDRRKLELQLPPASVSGLSIQSNSYTVNKAGIYCNRIIDIGVSGGFTIYPEWDVQ